MRFFAFALVQAQAGEKSGSALYKRVIRGLSRTGRAAVPHFGPLPRYDGAGLGAMEFTVRPIEVKEILPWRELYRQEMNCQIVHDSLHAREGWTQPYLIEWDGEVVGYGSIVVGGPWAGTRTLFEFYVMEKQRARFRGRESGSSRAAFPQGRWPESRYADLRDGNLFAGWKSGEGRLLVRQRVGLFDALHRFGGVPGEKGLVKSRLLRGKMGTVNHVTCWMLL